MAPGGIAASWSHDSAGPVPAEVVLFQNVPVAGSLYLERAQHAFHTCHPSHGGFFLKMPFSLWLRRF